MLEYLWIKLKTTIIKIFFFRENEKTVLPNCRLTFWLFTKLAAAYKGFAKQRPPPPICRNEAWEPSGDLAEWRPSRFSGDA